MGSRHSRLLGLLILMLAAAGTWPAASAAAGPSPASQLTGLAASQLSSVHACAPPSGGSATCFAQVVVRAGTRTPVHPHRPAHARPAVTTSGAASPAVEPAATPAPSPGTAGWLQQAYDLTWLAANRGAGDTVAIVDAYADPTIATDLAQFRAANGLPPCTTSSGCFTVVDQNGQTTPPTTSDTGWDTEQALDVEAVSSLCPSCHILLVESNSDSWSDLYAAVQTADAMGAQQISMSFGGEGSPLSGTWAFPGVSSLAAAGDSGYQGDWNDTVPATNPGVTAVGGTSLDTGNQNARGFGETTWSLAGGWGTGSGCDLYESKPSWQADTGCTGRAWNDVSADADPNSGLSIYDAGAWEIVGGTSLATPLTAAFEAITSVNGSSPQWAYTDRTLLNDVVSGSSGTCTTEPAYICNAGPGYDGPTGNGSISGDVVTGAPGIGASWAPAAEPGTVELAGGVYPNGLDTTYWWEYGTTSSYGGQTAGQDIGAGPAAVSVQDLVDNLTPATTYHFRLVARNADGTVYGPDETVTTSTGIASDPVSLSAPSITGAAERGATLTAGPGTWSASTSLSYQWQEAASSSGPFVDITGATGDQYVLTAGDVGQFLRVLVIDDDSGSGLAEATSAAVGPVGTLTAPADIAAPSIGGTPTAGATLTASAGTWSPSGTVAYEWLACGQPSGSPAACQALGPGAVSGGVDSFTIPAGTGAGGYGGDYLRVTVTETNAAGQGSATSAAVGPVLAPTSSPAPAPSPAPLPPASSPSGSSPPGSSPPAPAPGSPAAPPVVIAVPSLHGQPRLGSRVWVSGGRFWNATRETVRYYRCTPRCRPAGPVGASTYRLGAPDVGGYIRARVTLSGPGGQTTIWVPGLLGPVTSADAGTAGLRLGGRATLRAGRWRALASVRASGATAASRGISGRVSLRFAPAGPRQTVSVWACVLRGRELVACTRRRVLRRRLRLTLRLANGERVQVVAVRRGRRAAGSGGAGEESRPRRP